MSQKRQRVSLVNALYTTSSEGLIFLAQTQHPLLPLHLLLQGEIADHLIFHLISHLASRIRFHHKLSPYPSLAYR